MNEQKLKEANNIIKKVTKTPIMAKFTLFTSLFFLLLCLYGVVRISSDNAAIVFIIAGSLLSLTCFLIYFIQKRKIKSNIKGIDLEKVKREIMSGVISNDKYKTYFTESYMLSNFYYGFIVEYKDIIWIYDRDLIDPTTLITTVDLVICTINGKKYHIVYLDSFVDEIIKHNKNVLVGNDKETKDKYKEILKNKNNI